MNITPETGVTALRVLLWILVPPAFLLLQRDVLLNRLMPGKQEQDRVEPIAADPEARPSMKVLMSLCGVGPLLALAWGLLRFLLSPVGSRRAAKRSPSLRLFPSNP